MAIEWLRARVPGFDFLQEDELQAICDFTLLWSLFEARMFPGGVSAQAICEMVERWSDTGSLSDDPYASEFEYIQSRYYARNEFTHQFYDLRFRRNNREALVRSALDGTDNSLVARATVTFIVIYRYRNNLFHGAKWDYDLAGQQANFSIAISALMKALDRHTNI